MLGVWCAVGIFLVGTWMQLLPQSPYDQQPFVDADGITWQWSSKLDVWQCFGASDHHPLASETTVGLMSAADKQMLDSLPVGCGGFGFLVSPLMSISTLDNPLGVVTGPIRLCSDSLDITPVHADGTTIEVANPSSADQSTKDSLGIKFAIKPEFLDNIYLEISGPPGQRGYKGLVGEAGRDGFNNGPAGEKGPIGRAATKSHTFTGIKVIESDVLTDTPIINVELDQQTGRLVCTKSKVNVPDSSRPADQLIASPANRVLSYPLLAGEGKFVTLDDWELSIPPGDPVPDNADMVLLHMSDGLQTGDLVELTGIRLTDFVKAVVAKYKVKLADLQQNMLEQARAFMQEKDAAARTILASLAQQLAACEFERPLEFCVGIKPNDCGTTSAPSNNGIVDIRYNPEVPGIEVLYATGGWVSKIPVNTTCPPTTP